MKKKHSIEAVLALILCILFVFTGCNSGSTGNGGNGSLPVTGDNGQNSNESGNTDRITADGKVLVAYFSATNTTKGVAEAIHRQIEDSDIYQIVPAEPYTSADLNYGDPDSRTSKENRDDSIRPEIRGSVENIGQYDVILIGYPIWHGKAPKIIYTFLESYNLAGVTIIPFCTSASSGIGSSGTDLHRLTPSANWKDGARISGYDISPLIAQMNH